MKSDSYRAVLLVVVVLCLPLLAVAAPKVVVSIKPVHSLIAGVMSEIGTPELLIRDARSPHDLNLAPSDVRKLSRADKVFWIGPTLESSMTKIVQSTVGHSGSVELLRASGMEMLEIRASGLWDDGAAGEKGNEHSGHAEDQEQHGSKENGKLPLDPHIWLSPHNAEAIVRAATTELSLIDPQNADQYRRNSELVIERIKAMDIEIGQRLSQLRGLPYVVFHDAYAYFEHHYGLNAVGSLSVSAERTPGVRRVQQLRDRIKTLGARCVFSEPQFESALVRTLVEGTDARTGRLDPLGAGLTAGPDAYFMTMKGLADALVDCLTPAH